MKKLLLLLALSLLPSCADAQCNGVFPNNTACGNVTGSSNTPRPIPLSSFPANAPGGTTGEVQTNGGGGTFAGITNTQLGALVNQALPQSTANVRLYGALGNSDGTHSNGADDTVAIQAAVSSAGQTVNNSTYNVIYFPCGTYRITSGITGNAAETIYALVGAGSCSQIFLDNTGAATAFSFTSPGAPTSSCGGNNSLPHCLTVTGLYFITPNSSVNTIAVYSEANVDNLYQGNIFHSYQTALSIKTGYGPQIVDNLFLRMSQTAVDCSLDLSCNAAQIWRNRFYANGLISGDAAIKVGPGAGATTCTTAPNDISILGNDISGNYGGLALTGTCAVDIRSNYFEDNTAFAFYASVGVNKGISVANNWINGNPAIAADNITGIDFTNNTLLNQTIGRGSGTGVNFGYNTLEGTSAITSYCAPSVNCNYTGQGNLHQWGTVTTSSGSGVRTATITYPVACPTSAPSSFIVSGGDGNPAITVQIGTASTTSAVVSSSTGPATVFWDINCK